MRSHRHGVIVLLALAGLALPPTATAQMVRGWGVKGGLVGAYQSFSYVPGLGSPAIPRAVRWGYTAGLFVEFLNEGIVSIAIEGAYTQKGRRVTSQEITRAPGEQPYLSSGPEGITPWLGYVSTSLSVKVRTGSRGTRPYMYVGPRFDFLVSRPGEPAPVFTGFKTHDIGINIGLGLEVASRRHPALSLELRWSPGFSRVFSNDAVGVKNATCDLLLALWL